MNTSQTLKKLEVFLSAKDETCLDICGKFHAHLTLNVPGEQIDDCRTFCREQKVKLTVIDLENASGKKQTDVMTTSHYLDAAPDAVSRITTQLHELATRAQSNGFPVVRAKLEHESLPSFSRFDRHRYHEVHIKLQMPNSSFEEDYQQLKEMGKDFGFVPSRNPLQRDEDWVTQFVNLRIYEGHRADADEMVARVEEALTATGFQRRETKRETVVFDTAQELDGWWA